MKLGAEVTDPAILAQLNASNPKLGPEVTDPDLLRQLNGESEQPGALKSAALGAMSGVPGAETAVSGIESLATPKTYEEAHQELENLKNQAWEGHPIAYGAGKTAGMVGTAVAAPASIPGAIAIGAAAGLDAATKPSEMIESGLKGAGTGAMLGTIGEKVVSPLINKALPAAAKGAVASLGKETTVQDIQDYLNNPEAIRNALTKGELATKTADITSDIGKASGQLSNIARGTLQEGESPLSQLDIKPVFEGLAQKYLTNGVPATAADETAIKTISDQYGRLLNIAKANNGAIPETVLRDVIDHLQDSVKANTWGNPEASASQGALKEISGQLNDLLRQSNPEYAAKMTPSAEAAQLSGAAKEQFGLESNLEGKLAPTDTTSNKLANVLKEGKPEGADILDKIKNATGQDLQDMIQKATTREHFEAEGPGGGVKALLATLGYGAGRTTGVPFGGIAGAAAGRYGANAVNGGNLAKAILDMYVSGSEAYGNSAVIKPLVSKFGPILAQAAKVGGNQLAATHFVLATSNPEYQQLTDHIQGNQ